jgi:hypothetical protein
VKQPTNKGEKMKTKSYAVTESGNTTIVEATSQVKALAKHFGCERPVRRMGFDGEWANQRSKVGFNANVGYRTAKICEVKSA